MPEIIVRAEPEQDGDAPVVLRERVTEHNLESGHYADQLIERIGWALVGASEVQSESSSDDPRHATGNGAARA